MFDTTQLFSLQRGGFSEVVVAGDIVVHDGQKIIFQTRDCLGQYPTRSLLKPFQFLATGITETMERELRLVPCLGSISASIFQLEQLKSWYSHPRFLKLINRLQLSSGYPADEESRVISKREGAPPSPLFHMCFSKHMAILESCQINHWDLDSYTNSEHPYHKKLMGLLSQLLEENIDGIPLVVDGCLLPSPVFTVAQMAKLYQRLAAAGLGTDLNIIQQRMIKNPSWIGGPDRIDTLLMQKNTGLIAKEGADGLLGISILPNKRYPSGLGIVVKTWVGYQPKMAALAIAPLLKEIGLIPIDDLSPGHSIKYFYRPFKNKSFEMWDISPELSEAIAVWPGDIKFSRSISLDTQKGNHLTLSSIETTLHVGAHTDAINHFEKNDSGIESQSLEPYCGSCQVISINKKRATLIEKADLQGIKLVAKRILVKTGSFPDPKCFNEDFVSFSEEAIEYLGEQGVILVGIDTPSIDYFSSKELAAHHATFKWQMRILEGIDLSNVDEGIYYLSAIPLKIKGADASPVRAILFSNR